MAQKNAIEQLGIILAWLGGLAYAGIFVIVLLNGSWPVFLRPVQARFALASELLGSFSFVLQALIFVGPGLLVNYVGQRLRKN